MYVPWRRHQQQGHVQNFPWIARARRLLTIEELNEAFAIDRSDQSLDRTKIHTIDRKILEACGSLILFDKDDRTMTFAHHTVKQFLTTRLIPHHW
jgi:hypothetical protein